MAKKYKFEKYKTRPESQEKEVRRLFAAVSQATIQWVEEGKVSAETANHRISCYIDLLARLGQVPLEPAELKNFTNPPLQLDLFG